MPQRPARAPPWTRKGQPLTRKGQPLTRSGVAPETPDSACSPTAAHPLRGPVGLALRARCRRSPAAAHGMAMSAARRGGWWPPLLAKMIGGREIPRPPIIKYYCWGFFMTPTRLSGQRPAIASAGVGASLPASPSAVCTRPTVIFALNCASGPA